ncbi:MAG: hypothetical protein IE918_07800 [Campylobacterales bacterium]|nr:hypothetical protein [Campylobacterales bacterium]
MEKIKRIADIALVILSAYMIFDGFLLFIGTSGRVSGSEFGMLITLANQLSLIMVWLGLFAVRSFSLKAKEA